MAEQKNTVLRQLNQLNLQQIMGLVVGIAASIAMISGAWMWGQAPDYRLLYSNLSDRDGGAIIESLQQLNIPYKFTDGGGALMVPSSQVYEARLKLAAQGLPKGGTVGFELMENQKFGITQFAEQVNYQRALEGELARSVQSIGSVAGARVHLAIPKPSVFVKDQQKPSASVVLNLHGGRLLDAAQVSAIVHLISSSVPELSAKSVTVVDQNGTLLSANHEGGNDGLDGNQLKYVQQIEQNYAKRIEALLMPLLGANNVRAQVTADIDFSRTEQTAEIYKPNQNAAENTIRSQQSSESMNGSGISGAGGIPGALTNQPPAPATAPIVAAPGTPGGAAGGSSANLSNLQKESTINYEVDRTIRHTILPVGMIKRVSVAVVVNGNRKVTDAKGKSSVKTLSDADKTQINSLAKDAMGFDQARGDILNVQVAAFNEDKEAVEEVPIWKQPGTVELAKEIVKYMLIGLAMLFAIFGIIKPSLRPLFTAPEFKAGENFGSGGEERAPGGAAAENVSYNTVAPYEQNLQVARQISQQDPKIVATVIKEWVSGNE